MNRMKKILLFIFVFVTTTCYSQTTIYVKSNTDKRLLAYQDSLDKYSKNEKDKKYVKKRLMSVKDLAEYKYAQDSLKLVTTGKEFVSSTNGQIGYEKTNTKPIIYELICRVEFEDGSAYNTYFEIVRKPKQVVIFKPIELNPIVDSKEKSIQVNPPEKKQFFTVQYWYKKNDNEARLDSSKVFIVESHTQ